MNNTKVNYEQYLLDQADFEVFKANLGNEYQRQMLKIHNYITKLPDGIWIDFAQGVPVSNIPILIGLLCIYCREHWSAKDYIQFAPGACKIRRTIAGNICLFRENIK